MAPNDGVSHTHTPQPFPTFASLPPPDGPPLRSPVDAAQHPCPPPPACPILPLLLDVLPAEVASSHLLGGLSRLDQRQCRLACAGLARLLGRTVGRVRLRADDVEVVTAQRLRDRFPHVHILHVSDHPKQYMRDPKLEELLRRCFGAWPALDTLDLRGCNHLTTYGLHVVGKLCSQLPRLTALSLPRWTDNLGVRGVSHLTSLTSLELGDSHLDVMMVDDSGLAAVGALHALHVLSLERCVSVTDVGVGALVGLRGLRRLNLSRTNITGKGLSALAASSQLHSINLSDCRGLTDAGLSALACISSIQEVNLSNTPISNAGLEALSPLGFLETLTLGNKFGLQDQGLLALSQLPCLRCLKLGTLCLTQELFDCQAGPRMASLTQLELGGMYANTGLELLFPLPSLEHLRLQGFDSVTDSVLADVCRQRSLTSLSLSGGYQLTPSGMLELQKLPLLSSLELAVCPHVTPDCLAPLQGLSRLNLRACPQLPSSPEGIVTILPQVEMVTVR